MGNGFRPLRPFHGYLPIEDHGLIGDGRGVALVGRDGGISWLCVPRFDSAAVFCGLLDRHRGGAFRVTPRELLDARQRYQEDTGVLVTELRTRTGVLEITDAFIFAGESDLPCRVPAGRGELLRRLRVPEGEVTVDLEVAPRGTAGGDVAVDRDDGGWRLRSPAWPDVRLHLATSRPTEGVRASWRLTAGEPVYASLSWQDRAGANGGGTGERSAEDRAADRTGWPEPEQRLAQTRASWRRWVAHVDYDGPRAGLVRRSAITLKLLDHADGGAIVAAPTSSLPEAVGGPRNWDYRYTWVRDAAFSVYALRRIGLASEADTFLDWVLEAVDRHGEPRVLYDLDGHPPAAERVDEGLSGYRGSHPVRWGNGAADQSQNDVYGEILDCAYQRVAAGGAIEPAVWSWLAELAERAGRRWAEPDHGIWEIRAAPRRFTYSVALCQVALDRAARIATRLDLPGDRTGWAAEAEKIRQAVLDQAWDPDLGTLTEHLRGHDGPDGPLAGLDASVLALPLRRVVPSAHPKMVATTAAVAERLGAGDGLLYRYLPDASPDGLPGHEGAFLLCSFWLVDNLARQGRLEEAEELYESLCARANPLGLLPEQIDPTTGAFLGNYPQAFSHVGVIGSGLNLARAAARQRTPRNQGE